MFLLCWYFDFLCKFKIFNEPWYIDKRSFLLYFAYFFSSKVKDWSLKLAYASQFMQNMAVDSLIENIKTKIVIKFHLRNFMTYLARVANSMVIFSASYERRNQEPSSIKSFLRRFLRKMKNSKFLALFCKKNF